MIPRDERDKPLVLSRCVLEDIRQQKEFERVVRQRFGKACEQIACEPEINPDLLARAAIFYAEEIAKANDAQKSTEKTAKVAHFHYCGILAFWLAKYTPAYKMRQITGQKCSPEKKEHEQLMQKYLAESLAFDIGLTICAHYEKRHLPAVDSHFLQQVCFMIRYQSIPASSIGVIYRSLFVPLPEVNEEEGDFAADCFPTSPLPSP